MLPYIGRNNTNKDWKPRLIQYVMSFIFKEPVDTIMLQNTLSKEEEKPDLEQSNVSRHYNEQIWLNKYRNDSKVCCG